MPNDAVDSRLSARVVMVVPHIDAKYGGIAPAVASICSTCSKEGIEWKILAIAGPDERNQFIQDTQRVEVLSVTGSWWLSAYQIYRALAALASGCEVIHVHGLWTPLTIAAALVGQSLDIPVVISPHGMLEPWALRQKGVQKAIYGWMIERRIIRSATLMHALTPKESLQIKAFAGGRGTFVIPNAVNTDDFVPFRGSKCQRTERTILFLSRIHPKKGLDQLIRAFAASSVSTMGWRLIVAGAGEADYESEMRDLAAATNCSTAILFVGAVGGAEKRQLMSEADVFALTSYSEGLSMAVLESLACAVPVLGTPGSNVEEIVDQGGGWMAQSTVSDIADTIRSIARVGGEELAAKGQRARAIAEAQFSYPAVGKQWAAVYFGLARTV